MGSGLLATLYVAGFLVVSVHHGQYGIVMFEFLRARVFAAGILLTLFVAFPMLATWICMRFFEHWKTRGKLGSWINAFIFFLLALQTWVMVAGSWMSGMARSFSGLFTVSTSPFKPPLSIFAVWFLVLGAIFAVHFRLRRPVKLLRAAAQQGPYFFVAGLTVILYFATVPYGIVIPFWGGGLPTPVTVHLSSKIPFSDSTDVSAYLVDETERGYYLIHRRDDHRASFVPREAVTSIDFEEVK